VVDEQNAPPPCSGLGSAHHAGGAGTDDDDVKMHEDCSGRKGANFITGPQQESAAHRALLKYCFNDSAPPLQRRDSILARKTLAAKHRIITLSFQTFVSSTTRQTIDLDQQFSLLQRNIF
jgi:hypothetical protein